MNLNTFLLMAQPAGTEGQSSGGGMSMIIFFGAMILIFYFFMIRPQQKKQKKIEAQRNELKKGDKIITIGGIHGKIVDVSETTFTIEVKDGTKFDLEKAAIALDGANTSKK